MKIKGFDLREVTSFPKSKNTMNMVHHFNYRQKKPASSPNLEQRKFTTPTSHPHHRSFAEVLKILRFLPLKYSFCSKVINTFKR